jgi:hypothetical protein
MLDPYIEALLMAGDYMYSGEMPVEVSQGGNVPDPYVLPLQLNSRGLRTKARSELAPALSPESECWNCGALCTYRTYELEFACHACDVYWGTNYVEPCYNESGFMVWPTVTGLYHEEYNFWDHTDPKTPCSPA